MFTFYAYIILIFSGLVVIGGFFSAKKEGDGYVYRGKELIYMFVANVVFMTCLFFISYRLGIESHEKYIDKQIYQKAISEKAVGFEGYFLYKYENSETFCIKMKIGKKPEVLSKNFCEKKQEKRVQEK